MLNMTSARILATALRSRVDQHGTRWEPTVGEVTDLAEERGVTVDSSELLRPSDERMRPVQRYFLGEGQVVPTPWRGAKTVRLRDRAEFASAHNHTQMVVGGLRDLDRLTAATPEVS